MAVTETTSFPALRQRLRDDYGFEVALKYRDSDGDLILLSTQNDFDELVGLLLMPMLLVVVEAVIVSAC